ncbi:MAG: bifunctional metallophosphatase/5'-nucleotidase [Methylococcus sp.]|nr:bifunctional metallophosphatase/5'-nucleotidase [Methylococcus sp.]
MLLVLALCGPVIAAEPSRTALTLLHVNDSHSNLSPIGPKTPSGQGTLGGVARLASLVEFFRQTDENLLFLHAGDVFTGTFFFERYSGFPEFRVLRQLGLDALALGNHEFDRGVHGLREVLERNAGKNGFPVLSANVRFDPLNADANALRKLVLPSMLLNRAGLRIGLFGMTTPDLPLLTPGVSVAKDTLGIVAGQTAALRGQGADLVILVSHLGKQRDAELAEKVSGIDVIVGGHDHAVLWQPEERFAPDGWRTLILQAGAFYRYLGKLDLEVTRQETGPAKVEIADYRMFPIDERIPENRKIRRTVAHFVPGIEQAYGKVFSRQRAVAAFELANGFDPERPSFRDTPLGNMVTDAFRARIGADAGLIPKGLISQSIYGGKVVDADILRVLPYGVDLYPAPGHHGYGYKLASVRVPGKALFELLELATRLYLNIPGELQDLPEGIGGDDYALQVSGLSYAYDPRPLPNLQWTHVIPATVQVAGQSLRDEAIYTIATDSLVTLILTAAGLVPLGAIDILDCYEYEVLRDYAGYLGTLAYVAEGRVREETAGLTRGSLSTSRLQGVFPRFLETVPTLFRGTPQCCSATSKSGLCSRP